MDDSLGDAFVVKSVNLSPVSAPIPSKNTISPKTYLFTGEAIFQQHRTSLALLIYTQPVICI